jgi:hypothetical protein
MWITDLFLALPQLPLLLLVIYLFRDFLKNWSAGGGVFILIVLVIGGFPLDAGGAAGAAQFLSLREKEFVEAARALGATTPRLVIRHILPNSLGPVIVAGTIDVAAGDHRGIDAVVSRPRLPALIFRPGGGCCSTPRIISTSRRTGRCSPVLRFS